MAAEKTNDFSGSPLVKGLVFVSLAFVFGSFLFLTKRGWSELGEKWGEWLAFGLGGFIIAWCVLFVVNCTLAP